MAIVEDLKDTNTTWVNQGCWKFVRLTMVYRQSRRTVVSGQAGLVATRVPPAVGVLAQAGAIYKNGWARIASYAGRCAGLLIQIRACPLSHGIRSGSHTYPSSHVPTVASRSIWRKSNGGSCGWNSLWVSQFREEKSYPSRNPHVRLASIRKR